MLRNGERSEESPLLATDHQSPKSSDPHIANDGQKTSASVAFTIAIAIFGVFLASADECFVTATYSTIASEFLRNLDGPWLLLSYNLGYCYALPIYGSLSDSFGYKRPLMGGYCLFIVGCLVSLGIPSLMNSRSTTHASLIYRGSAGTLDQAIVGRLVAGLGGAGMVAMASVLAAGAISPSQVAVLRSCVTIAAAVGKSAGAPLGGFLADVIGWRWSFGGQAPLALLCLAAVAFIFDDNHHHKSGEDWNTSKTSRLRRWSREIDWLGAIFSALCITTGLSAMSLGGAQLPWLHPLVISAIAVCVSTGGLFAITEKYWTERPLIPPELVTHNGIGGIYVVQMLLCIARFGSMAQVSAYFIRTKNLDNSIVGAYLAPTVLATATGALIGGVVISRTLRYKAISVVAICIGILGYTLMFVRWRYIINFWESLYYLGAGLSHGICLNTQFIGLTAAAPEDRKGAAIGVFYLSQEFGIILGIGIFAAIFETAFNGNLNNALENLPGKVETIKAVLEDSRAAFQLPAQTQQAVLSAYLSSFNVIPAASIVFLILALCIILYLRERPLK